MEYQLKILVSLTLVFICTCSFASSKAPPFNASKAYKNNASIISVPVRVHLLKSEDEKNITAQITQQELEEVFNVVNLIWKQAGIKYHVESASYLPASNEKQYIQAMSKNSKLSRREKTRAMNQVCNISNQTTDVLNLCVIGKTVNGLGGVYFGGRKPKVIWPTLAKSGKNLLNPATLAHELGHYLGLKHNAEDDIYLMKGRGNNMRRKGRYEYILLSEREITVSRKNAIKLFN